MDKREELMGLAERAMHIALSTHSDETRIDQLADVVEQLARALAEIAQ